MMQKNQQQSQKNGYHTFTQPMIQTKVRGTHEQEYEIYVENARALGWNVKTFDEWMAS